MSFVTINNTSIKVSNIKNFGISSTLKNEVVYYLMEKKTLPDESKTSKVTRRGFSVIATALLTAVNIVEGTRGSSFVPPATYCKYELVKIKKFSKKYFDIPKSSAYKAGDTGPVIDAYYIKNKEGKIELLNKLDEDTRYGFEDSVTDSNVVERRYLYITTFQNDNYQFFDYEIDLDKEHKNLLSLV